MIFNYWSWAICNSPLSEGCPQDGVFTIPSWTGFFLFDVKKTSVASLNAVENIKALEKTKVSAENFCIEVSAWAWPVDSQKFVRPI